jgi:uncharacterized RDD family membrane protein YckC
MSCPICGDDCRCAEPRSLAGRETELAEIDDYDPTEEQFASSLAGREMTQVQELASGTLMSARQRYAAVLPDVAVEAGSDLLLTSPANPDAWRDEVSSRIQNYKARRRRSLGDESLSFNFESTTGNHVFLRPEREPEPEPMVAQEPTAAYCAHATAPAFEDGPVQAEERRTGVPAPHMSAEPEMDVLHESAQAEIPALQQPETAKLILFPKPPMMLDAPVDQLAEPVFDVPRIVEAREAEAVTVPLADITLQPEVTDDCVPFIEPLLELPVPVAPVAQRVFGEIVDVLMVLFATGIFAIIVAKIGGDIVLTDKHTIAGLLILVPGTFWAVYKYLFLVHGGQTIGMRMTRLKLVDFEGSMPTRAPRRYRAMAMMMSAFPLGLGLLWSFVDTESLCWHDRISRTYLTAEKSRSLEDGFAVQS